MVYRIIFILLFSSNVYLTFSQELIPIDSWRTHPSFNNLIDGVQIGNTIFAHSASGILVYNTIDSELSVITSRNGISKGQVTTMSVFQNQLIIGFNNGRIDVYNNGVVRKLNGIFFDDIANNLKRINHIYSSHDKFYVSTDFGIVVFDDQFNIVETYKQLTETGESLPVIGSIIVNNTVYLLSNDKVIVGSLSKNLLDFNNWEVFNSGSTQFSSINSYDSRIILLSAEGDIYEFDGADFSVFYENSNLKFIDIQTSNELILSTTNEVFSLSEELNLLFSSQDFDLNGIFQSSNSTLFGFDKYRGLINLTRGGDILPNGPGSNNLSNGFGFNETLGMYSDPLDFGLNSSENQTFSIFNRGIWKSIDLKRDFDDTVVGINIIDEDFTLIGFDGNVAKYTNYQIEGEQQLSMSNITSAAWRNYDFFYIAFFDNTLKIALITPNGQEIYDFPYPYFLQSLHTDGRLLIGNFHPDFSSGIFVYDIKTGESRVLTSTPGQGGLPSSRVHSIDIDRDGELWVGTDNGIAYFPFVNMTGEINAVLPVVEFFPVLRGEKINVLTVDPANNKWVGTNKGAWLFNENSTDELINFTAQNSPLLDNEIRNISIIKSSGEVFFNTKQGLISYRGNATKESSNYSNIKVFPNPVYSMYQNAVAVSGLPFNSTVKITDIMGNLLWEGKSNGGTVSWDLIGFNGDKVKSGIYIVLMADEDGIESNVGKLAVVN